jgi:hypothetical protein
LGVREAVRFGDNKTFRTLVSFRRGRIVGTAMVVRVDREDGANLAQRLVGILDTRARSPSTAGRTAIRFRSPSTQPRPTAMHPRSP